MPSIANNTPNTSPKRPVNAGQSSPNSKERTVPVTAPTANVTATAFDQRCASLSASASFAAQAAVVRDQHHRRQRDAERRQDDVEAQRERHLARAAPRFDASQHAGSSIDSDLRAETRLDQPGHGHPMWMSRPRWEALTVTPMAEVVETATSPSPSQNGWALDYRIRREDGEELHAEVRCWDKAHATAERAR